MAEYELKPCPFCGGTVKIHIGVVRGLTMIVCGKCLAAVSFGGKERKDATVKAWNRRAKDG